MDKQPKRKKKPNKQAREKARAERADLYNEAFLHGYNIGFGEGYKVAAQQGERERRKWAHFGR